MVSTKLAAVPFSVLLAGCDKPLLRFFFFFPVGRSVNLKAPRGQREVASYHTVSAHSRWHPKTKLDGFFCVRIPPVSHTVFSS